MDVEVNWQNLVWAISQFQGMGYKYVEVPWTVPAEFTRATCPEERWIVGSSIGELVGSSEQSFMYLDQTKQLGKGKFVACTPCFRNEDHPDALHQKHFMKVELYVNDASLKLDVFVQQVLDFHRNLLPDSAKNKLQVRAFDDGTYDIELDGIEIGSYGFRAYRDIAWLYGTAIAEPRFSTALKKANIG